MPTRRLRAKRLTRIISPILVTAALAAFAAVVLWDGPSKASSVALLSTPQAESGAQPVLFGQCHGPQRHTCVVDGDTFWYRGEKIRIADINTPELSNPQCATEAKLAKQATLRLVELLNAGPFTLEPVERETDRYGRSLRIITRHGESLGETLVGEGLAERWKGYRSSWC